MSEIYNGTFVLGNTSATTLSAGPGIKIDDSTPGVIKVSNDETVLWSGNHYWWTTSSMQVSEPLSGFERIKIYARDDWELPISIFEVPGDATSIQGQCQGIENNKLTIKAGKWTVSGNTITLNDKLAVNCTPGSSPSWTTDSSVCFIQFSKIVGINRKEGN